MTTFPVITCIWDFGWLVGDELQVPPGTSDHDLLEYYVASSAFHTSFLSSDLDETGIHGPFLANRITAGDFTVFEETALEEYLKTLFYSPELNIPASAEQFATVLDHLRKPFAEGMRCFLLRFDESRSDLQHDWGFVLMTFREFLFLDHRAGFIKRFVIGYD
jgi:hypothetical protein